MSVPGAEVQPHKRLYYLDWLRVFIIGGVFLAHTVLPFTGGDWLIVSGAFLPIAGFIAIVGNQFGMPLLFLISGAAVVFSMRRRGNRQFIRERFMRLIVPYIILVFLLSPIQAYYEALDHGWYSGSFIGYLPQFFNLAGFTGFNLEWAGHYGYHLWFLVFLFFYAVVTVPLFTFLRGAKGPQWFNRFDRWLHIPGFLILVPGIIIGLGTGLLRLPFPGYQDWADTYFWGMFFVFGYIIYSDQRLIELTRRAWKAALLWIVLTLAGLILLALYTLLNLEDLMQLSNATVLRLGSGYLLVNLLLATNSWAFIILFLALGMRLLDFTNKRLDYLGEASMPFYLLHHPAIVIIAFYVTQIAVLTWGQLLTIGCSAFIVTAFLYHLFLRRWNPFRLALGLRPLKRGEMPTTRRVWVQRAIFLAGVFAFAIGVAIALPLLGQTTYTVTAASLPVGWTAIVPGGTTTCGNGTPFQFFARPATGSQKLLIYFQAGGACWDAQTCDDESLAYDKSINYAEFETYRGIFDFANPENPVADYNWVFVPYCTADVHTGSRDRTYTDALGLQETLRHQGFVNARSVLQWVQDSYPTPERVVVTGSSAGALGSIFFAESIMSHYASVPVIQLGDGYVGIMPKDWTGLDVWGTRANEPLPLRQALASAAPDVYTQRLYASSADFLPQRIFAQFTTAADVFQIGYYAMAGGTSRDWPNLMRQSIEQLDQVSNFRSYVADGAEHTILPFDRFYTTQINGVRFRDWFASLINDQPVSNVACARGSSLTCP
jgi:glucan biosynthesis protein C